jgi:hypothetical protein
LLHDTCCSHLIGFNHAKTPDVARRIIWQQQSKRL